MNGERLAVGMKSTVVGPLVRPFGRFVSTSRLHVLAARGRVTLHARELQSSTELV